MRYLLLIPALANFAVAGLLISLLDDAAITADWWRFAGLLGLASLFICNAGVTASSAVKS